MKGKKRREKRERGLREGPGAVVGHTPILKIKEDIEFQRGLIVKLNPQKVS
jgi:hypothetical protein